MKAFKDGKVAMIVNGPWDVDDTYAGKAVQGQGQPRHRPRPGRLSSGQGAPQGGHNLAVYAGSKNLRGLLRLRRVHELGRGPGQDADEN